MNFDRAVIAADVHLKPRTWAKHPRLVGDAYAAWQWLCSYCGNNGYDLILLGDVFDSTYPDSRSVAVYQQGVQTVQDGGGMVAFIQGNHDGTSPPWCSFGGAFSLHNQAGRLGDLPYYGIDYTHPSRLSYALEQVPDDTAVLFMHQAWNRLMGDGRDASEVAAVPSVRYLISGDYHDYRRLELTHADGSPLTVISPGSTYLTRLNHSPAKFVVRYMRDSNGFIPVEITATRPFASFSLELESDWAAMVSSLTSLGTAIYGLPEELQLPLVRVRYMPQFAEEITLYAKRHASVAYFVLEPSVPAIAVPSADNDTALPQVTTLEQAVEARLSGRVSPELLAWAKQLAVLPAENVPKFVEEGVRHAVAQINAG